AELGNDDIDRLQLLAQVLGGSRSSRLDARLLHRDQLVDSISAGTYAKQLGSNFIVMANVKQGVDPAKVEAVIDEEIDRLLAEGPTADELERARTVFRAGFVRGIERIGGFGGKADALAECAVYADDPGCFRDSLRIIQTATAEEVQATGKTWLAEGDHTLLILPGERTALEEDPAGTPRPWELPAIDARYSTQPATVDRSLGVPLPEAFPELKFPDVERATLANGSTVVLARRTGVPVVQLRYQFPGAGYTADAGHRMGTASFAMGMLDEGAAGLGALEFADRAEALGAQMGAGAGLDVGTAWLSALKGNLDASVALFADMLRRPDFDAAEIERVRATWIANIAQEKARPQTAALRVLPPLLYGEGHPYAMPFTGSCTDDSIAALTRDDLVAFHRGQLQPEGATLIVVGDTTLAEIVPVLEKHLGDWSGGGEARAAAAEIPAVAR